MGIVKSLEVIKVEEDYTQWMISALRSLDFLIESVFHEAAVKQARQGIARRLIAEGFPQEQVGKGESNSAAHGDSEALLRFLQSLKRLGVR